MVEPHISHVVKLTKLDLLELHSWITSGARQKLVLDRLTFERTALDCVFVTTTPMPDLPRKPKTIEEELPDGL